MKALIYHRKTEEVSCW